MVCCNPVCLGNYDFADICRFAIQRFVEGQDTIDMINNAKSTIEVEEICLVSLLDVEDSIIQKLNMCCQPSEQCEVTTCRKQLREIIENEINYKKVI